ncbi:FR47-like protein [Seminavis robusta]|uniref:FR47-like protein n=1 Tax=Seminavis robusta TaxID=568900 RepID=A0A9N8E5A1_9STRA|nr:FR47-like protein [Seminavis robusta]|eukprot:Sro632_g178730.1 FR47-like protein (308) ;mRNA; r:53172-54095
MHRQRVSESLSALVFFFFFFCCYLPSVSSFGLLSRLTAGRTGRYTVQPWNPKQQRGRQDDELRLVTDLFVDSFWRGKVGGGAKELTESQNKTLQAQQYVEFKRRYSTTALASQLVLCKDTKQQQNNIIGCAGVQVDAVTIFAEEEAPKQPLLLPLLAMILPDNIIIKNAINIPAKPTGRWDTKMKYAPVMSNLVVSRHYRRQGIAEQLVAAVEEACQQDEWGYDECFLYVEQRNTPAVRLYQKLGYKTLWKDETAKTLLPTKTGSLESTRTTIVCMRKQLLPPRVTNNNNKQTNNNNKNKMLPFLPF